MTNDIAQLLRKLEWSSIKRGPGSGPHGSGGDGQAFRSCPMCGGIAPDQRGADMNFVASAIGHKEVCRLHAAAASLEAQEPVAWGCSGGSTIRQSTKVELEKGDAHDRERANEYNIPLYRHPPGPSSVAQEPVAWMHEDPERVDVIHTDVRKLLHDSADAAGFLHRPLDKSARYTIPLYRRPPTGAVPDGWKLVPARPTDEMMKATTGVHPGMRYANRDNAALWDSAYDNYVSMLAAAPQQGGGEDE